MISATILIAVSDTVYSICRRAKTTWHPKCLNFINECRSPKGDHRNIIFPSIYMTKWSVAETPTYRDHFDPAKDVPRTPRDPQGTPRDLPWTHRDSPGPPRDAPALEMQ